jgi:hypothetical protein
MSAGQKVDANVREIPNLLLPSVLWHWNSWDFALDLELSAVPREAGRDTQSAVPDQFSIYASATDGEMIFLHAVSLRLIAPSCLRRRSPGGGGFTQQRTCPSPRLHPALEYGCLNARRVVGSRPISFRRAVVPGAGVTAFVGIRVRGVYWRLRCGLPCWSCSWLIHETPRSHHRSMPTSLAIANVVDREGFIVA